MTIRVAVLGAGGRMGMAVCRAVAADAATVLAGAVDPAHGGRPLAELAELGGIEGPETVVGEVGQLDAGSVDVAVDFTRLDSALANARWCASAGVHDVIGTSGFGLERIEELRALFPPSGGVNCVVVPNFAVGAVLMMRMAELAAPWFETAEIVETHHDGKVDAPSGTSIATADRMRLARERSGSGDWAPDPTRDEVLPGARGARSGDGPRIHSLRLRGAVAHQEVVLGSSGQILTIRHDSYDRESFMPGVLLAVRSVGDRPGVTVGLDVLMGLE